MARTLFVAFLAICLVCALQASPLPDGDQQPASGNVVQDWVDASVKVAQQGLATVHQQIQNIVNDPTLQQIGQETQKLVEDGIKNARDTIGKLVPKTDP